MFSFKLSRRKTRMFPPQFVLVGPLLKFLQTQSCSFSIEVPGLTPRRYWWPLLQGRCSPAFLLGKKGVSGVLIFLLLFRAMVGGNSGPATAVNASPVVQCLCKKLEREFYSSQKKEGKTISRWRLILDAYHHIRGLVMLNNSIMTETNLQLYEIHQTTLLKWYEAVSHLISSKTKNNKHFKQHFKFYYISIFYLLI